MTRVSPNSAERERKTIKKKYLFYAVHADYNGCTGQKFDSGDIGMTLSLANTDPWDKAERILLILEDSTYQCSDGNMDFVDQGHDYELICDNIGNFCFIFLVYFNFSDCSVDHFLFFRWALVGVEFLGRLSRNLRGRCVPANPTLLGCDQTRGVQMCPAVPLSRRAVLPAERLRSSSRYLFIQNTAFGVI